MTLSEMIRQYLESNGFDGLYYSGECACKKDDLFPCGDPNMSECRPGYLQPCGSGCGEHDWHIGKERLSGDNDTQEKR